MTDQQSELFRIWAVRLSVVTTLIVILLSWMNDVKLLQLTIRAGFAYGVMYVLLVGTITLFDRTSLQTPQNKTLDSEVGYGGVIDFSVGDDEPQNLEGQESQFPGQVDQSLSSGFPNSERQADVVRRMGWD